MSEARTARPPAARGHPGRILGIFLAPRKGEPMVSLASAHAVAGKGLEGDRYFDAAGTFSTKISAGHELSLIEIEALEALKQDLRLELEPIQSRRNLLTRGVPLNHLIHREFSVGEVVLRGIELCEPCGHMEKLSGIKGVRAGLVHRGGLRCQIVRGGQIRLGDQVLEAPREEEPLPVLLAPAPSGMPSVAAKVAPPSSSPAHVGPVPPEVAAVDAMPFGLIPPGDFILGSGPDPMAWDNESPPQTQAIPYAYGLARFPVSAAQYGEFIRDGGYEQADYWPEAITAEVWRGGLLEHAAAEEALRAPWDFGLPFSAPAHPVVGVTWYEAVAFCRWLQGRWAVRGWLPAGWQVQLPSELEWEKAARGGASVPAVVRWTQPFELGSPTTSPLAPNPGPARRFPWGDELDSSRANSSEAGIAATSPLGQFPLGASPYGIEELSGNVWEWTRSLWGPYPYPGELAARAEREKLGPGQLRTLKGGGFNFRSSLIRCSARHCHSPMMRYRHIGFRVMVGPQPLSG